MAIVDANMVLSGSYNGNTLTSQTVTGSGSVISTYVLDLSQKRDLGEGVDLFLRVNIMTAFAGLTSLECQIVQADDAAISTNVTVIGSTGPIPLASLTAGARFVAEMNPRIGSIGQRYLAARYVITGTGTAGALMADIGDNYSDGAKTYPVGYTIL